MFTSKILEANNCENLIINHEEFDLYAAIDLTQGASLQNFTINNTAIIKPIDGFEYGTSYASSILFPFVSRTKLGMYDFDGKSYQLHCNTDDQKTALHGLLYNKKFDVLDIKHDTDCCEVHLFFEHSKPSKGYPFLFKFLTKYRFTKNKFTVDFLVENIGDSMMPFTIGWHPYFYAPNFDKTYISFESDEQVVYDNDLITKELIKNPHPKEFNFKDKSFDDCWLLTSDLVVFETENYALKITSNLIENYLQIYTPPKLPLIAIEPMLGISNSLNNKIGLQTLEPKKTFSAIWDVHIKTKNNE